MSLEEIFGPPLCVRGLKKLDKSLFTKTINVPAISLPTKKCSQFLKHFKNRVLKFPGVKKITDGSNENERLLLLQPLTKDNEITNDEMKWMEENEGRLTHHDIVMRYESYTINGVLKGVLPPDEVKDIPSGFETVGHIAHLNLQDNQQPYKHVIGQVLLDKIPSIKTVVNKTNSIDETYRTFKMELLAGEDNTSVIVKENGCSFQFDFSKVYWNSRLHTEHKRIIDVLKSDDVVIDMFAGVGPFAVPACKKKCRVFANDLNPFSYEALLKNAQINNVTLSAYNLDGRHFIDQVKGEILLAIRDKPTDVHILMNLPAIAVEFLDCFIGLYNDQTPLPPLKLIVHCYTFSKSADPEADVLKRVQEKLNMSLEAYSIFVVRDVSPNKLMMRVTFTLPYDVICAPDKIPIKAGMKRKFNSDDMLVQRLL
jgi:tRNA (guanine37-N1)-methyltransferase